MTALRALAVVALLAAAPAAAQAQTHGWQPRPGGPAIDPHRYQVEMHRLEIDRLRIQADQREAFARQLELEARLERQRLEAIRSPALDLPSPPAASRSLEGQSELRRSATARRRTVEAGMDEIDAWLDRSRR